MFMTFGGNIYSFFLGKRKWTFKAWTFHSLLRGKWESIAPKSVLHLGKPPTLMSVWGTGRNQGQAFLSHPISLPVRPCRVLWPLENVHHRDVTRWGLQLQLPRCVMAESAELDHLDFPQNNTQLHLQDEIQVTILHTPTTKREAQCLRRQTCFISQSKILVITTIQ